MIRIYCDDVYVEQDYYVGISKKGQLYSNAFRLGATLCEEYTITLDARGITASAIPKIVKLYDDEKLIKTLIVDTFEKDDFEIILDTKDYMIKGNVAYDASPLMVDTGKTTLKAILDDICQKMGVTNNITDFIGSNIEISWYNNQYSARTYLEYIAEINASYMYIGPDNELIMKKVKKDVEKEISFEELSNYSVGSKHIISRVVWDDTNNKWEFGDNTGETYYINTSNVYVVSEEIVENIYNEIDGFEFYNFKAEDCPLNDVKVGDIVRFYYENNSYNVIVQFSSPLNYSGGYWFGEINFETNNEEQQETQILGDREILKHLQTIVDRDSNTIKTVVAKTEEVAEGLSSNTVELNLLKTEVTQNESEFTTSITEIRNDLDKNVSNLQTNIDNTNNRLDNGVENLKNTLVTININGITVATNISTIQSVIGNDKFVIQTKSGTQLAFIGYDEELGKTIARMDNLTVTNYFTAGYHRQEKMKDTFETGWFYVRSDI